jgi:hypothetical protein
MDMYELAQAEKKELREEVHMIQNEQGRHDRDHDQYGNDDPERHHRRGVVLLEEAESSCYPDPVIVIRKYKLRESYSF